MKKDCSKLGIIIKELINDINQVKNVWSTIRDHNPNFEEVSDEHWEIKEALFWMHGETNSRKAIELERWLYFDQPHTQTAQSMALDHYLAWADEIRENRKSDELRECLLPKPYDDETLIKYVIRLSEIIEKNGWGSKKQERVIKSFLHFLRKDFCNEEVAFIEHIIPQKCDLKGGRIIRNIQPPIYPISQQLAGAIIKELAYQCAFGRPNARHHTGEALALIWLCITASRIRLPRLLESIYEIPLEAILSTENGPVLIVPSLFGTEQIRISNRIAQFLIEIGSISSKETRKTILQTSLPDLRKRLRMAIQKINPIPEIGEISFSTFLSYPHCFGKNTR